MDIFEYVKQMNDEELIKYLKTENINVRDEEGLSLLHIAIKYENDFAFDLLIKSYININIRDNDGNSPLVYSILYNKTGYFKRLVREKADLNIINNKKESAIMIALDRNKLEMANILFDENVDLSITNENDENIFFSLVRSHNLSLLKKMIEKNPEFLYSKNHSRRTLLHQAVMISDLNMCIFLLNKGILPNIEDNFKETPLFFAVRNNDEDIVSILLDYGALLGKTNAFYETVYDIANLKMLEYIKFKETSVKYIKYQKKYPLHCAIIYNDYPKTKQLLNRFNINKKDDFNILPIDMAKRLNHLEIYKLLEQYLRHCK